MKRQLAAPKLKLRKWVKRFIILALLFFPLKMAFEVSRVPNYDGADAFIDFSPDGKYRAALVNVLKKHRTSWTTFALGLTGHSHNLTYLISDPSGQTIYAMVPVDYYWVSNGSGTIWRCGEVKGGPCHSYRRPYEIEGKLPPSLWQRTHAWLTVRIKGFQNAQFGEVVNLDR